MAGRHVDAADDFARADVVSDYRGGCVAIAEEGREAGVREHFGRGEGKFAAEKTCVVADDDEGLAAVNGGVGVGQFACEVKRNALGGEADVVESEITRDETAPAGGAEFYGGGQLFQSNAPFLRA